MFIDEKEDYSSIPKKGFFYSKEINSMVKELLQVFSRWLLPNTNEDNQVIRGISNMIMCNTLDLVRLDDYMVMTRRESLPEPMFVNGFNFFLEVRDTNHIANIKFRFSGGELLTVKIRNSELTLGQLMVGEIYSVTMREVNGEKYLSILEVTTPSQIITTNTINKMVTTEPLLITNNLLTLPNSAFGDIVLNTVHVHTMVNGIMSDDFDTKRGAISNTSLNKVVIYDDNDGIDVNGMYGVVTYIQGEWCGDTNE